jgi:hypothetical protein
LSQDLTLRISALQHDHQNDPFYLWLLGVLDRQKLSILVQRSPDRVTADPRPSKQELRSATHANSAGDDGRTFLGPEKETKSQGKRGLRDQVWGS